MQTWIVALFTLQLFYSSVFGQDRKVSFKSVQVKPISAFLDSRLKFNIAGTIEGHSPNILSELEWSNVKTFAIGAEIVVDFSAITLDVGYFRGGAYSGAVSDIDYAEDGRTAIFSEQNLKADKGNYQKVQVFPKYRLVKGLFFDLDIFPSFSSMSQTFYLLNLENEDHQDYIPGLSSTYIYDNDVFGIGTSFSLRSDCILLTTTIDVGRSYYKAVGNWNLRTDLAQPVSYTHKANGIAVLFDQRLHCQISRRISGFIACSFNLQKTGSGLDRLYRENGGFTDTRLNEVILFTKALQAGINFSIIKNKKS